MNKKRKFRTASQLVLIGLLTSTAALPGFTSAISAASEIPESQVESPTKDEREGIVRADITGTWGTSNWIIDSSGVLHIASGRFANSTERSPWNEYRNVITKIVFEGDVIAAPDSHVLFYDLSKVSNIENLSLLDTSNVTTMEAMFSGMSNLSSLDVSNFDTSNVTDMRAMFSRMSNLSSLDVSNFDTSNVTTMEAMFSGMSNLLSLDVSNFDTSNVTTMFQMFNGMSNLSSLDVSNFDTSNTKYMTSMFNGMSNLSSLDVSNFDTSNVGRMDAMFSGMSNLSSLDVSNFDTSNVLMMDNMFSGMSNLSSLDVSNFDTSNTKYMHNMFSGMSNLSSLDVSNFDTSNVKAKEMSNMFSGTSNLSQLTLGPKFIFKESADLPEIISNETYTGEWREVGSGTLTNPLGSNKWTSQQLQDNYNGTTDAGTYTWARNAAKNVVVRYVDESNKNIHNAQVISGMMGESYDATTSDYKLNISGYTLNQSKLPANGKGSLGGTPQEVIYTYTKDVEAVQGGDVTVKYQDESGKTIGDSVTLKGNVGESYSSTKKSISGYTYKEVKGSATGKFTDKAQTVTYIYKKNATTTTPDKQETVNIYRLYNKKSQEHIYTSDKNEYTKLPKISKDWVQEGINFKGYKKSSSTTVAVRRVYNPKSGEHLSTTDANEVKVLKSKGWKDEGVSFYAPKTGGTPIYRLYNPKAGLGAHFVTADAYEKKVLTTAPKEWKYEGIAWRSVK